MSLSNLESKEEIESLNYYLILYSILFKDNSKLYSRFITIVSKLTLLDLIKSFIAKGYYNTTFIEDSRDIVFSKEENVKKYFLSRDLYFLRYFNLLNYYYLEEDREFIRDSIDKGVSFKEIENSI